MFPLGAGDHHITSVMSLFKFTLVIPETWWQRLYSSIFLWQRIGLLLLAHHEKCFLSKSQSNYFIIKQGICTNMLRAYHKAKYLEKYFIEEFEELSETLQFSLQLKFSVNLCNNFLLFSNMWTSLFIVTWQKILDWSLFFVLL